MRCRKSGDCAAFTFNTSNSSCFLKRKAGLVVSNPAAISGYRESPNSRIRRIDMTIQEVTDYPAS